MKIKVTKDGPYVVEGDAPLYDMKKVTTEKDEAMTWQRRDKYATKQDYALCRCGHSHHKPFCDGTHAKIGFDGTETADPGRTEDRQEHVQCPGFEIKSDPSICATATFCHNLENTLSSLLPVSYDANVRSEIVAMIEHCPSGALTYRLDNDDRDIEPAYAKEIGVTHGGRDRGGPLWVTGEIEIERSDKQPVETRNRMTLCRCGESDNKPFCDGSHNEANWDPDTSSAKMEPGE